MAVRFKVKFKGEDLGEFNSDKVTMNEALQLEDQSGFSLQEMIQQANRGSAKGIQAVVWFRFLQLGRPQPLHTDFTFGDFDVDPVNDEEDADPTPAADEVAELEKAFKKSETVTSGS